MAKLSFEDSIRALVKAKLNPDTEDLIARKSGADAEYYGGETTDFDKFAGVTDPFAKRRLVDQENQMSMRTSNTLGGALQNREVGITDIVGSFAKARQEELAAEQQDFERQQAERNYRLEVQKANSSASNAATSLALEKAKMERGLDPTDLQRDYDTISSISGKDAADRWLKSNAGIPDPKDEIEPAGPTNYLPYVGGALGAGAGLIGGAPLVATGALAAGGYLGAKALSPNIQSLWAQLQAKMK